MIRKQSPDTLRFLSMKICLWMNHVFLSIQLCQYLILIHKSSLIRVFTVNLLCHSGKPQIKIHARRYKNYFRANLPATMPYLFLLRLALQYNSQSAQFHVLPPDRPQLPSAFRQVPDDATSRHLRKSNSYLNEELSCS